MSDAQYELDRLIKLKESSDGLNRRAATREIIETQGQQILERYNVDGWKFDSELSTNQYGVLTKGNQTRIVFKGRSGNTDIIGAPRNTLEKLLGDEGEIGVDSRHVADTILNKKRDYSKFDQLYKNIEGKYGNNNIDVVSYSNGGPKGLYLAEKYNLPHTMLDGLMGKQEVKLLMARNKNSAPLEIIRPGNTLALAGGAGETAFQILSGETTPARREKQ